VAKPGPKPAPALKLVREGNPGKRPVRQQVVLEPASLAEPDWTAVFPSVASYGDSPYAKKVRQGEIIRARNIARREWRRVVPVLIRMCGLADIDEVTVLDYCVCRARIDQGERALSRDGMLQLGERGWQKNGWTTILGQYRTQLARYIGELGLSPSSRLTAPAGDDDDDSVFD